MSAFFALVPVDQISSALSKILFVYTESALFLEVMKG